MEEYLKYDYDVFEDDDLTSEEDIIPFFTDTGYDYFDCGQGYYQDEAIILAKIGDKFFYVTLKAEVWGDKQDRGDKLYYVESITSITYVEIEKPLPKLKKPITIEFTANDAVINQVFDILTRNGVEWIIVNK